MMNVIILKTTIIQSSAASKVTTKLKLYLWHSVKTYLKSSQRSSTGFPGYKVDCFL